MDLTALAYCGAPPVPDDLWGRWNMDPFVVAGLIALVGIGRHLGARMPPLAAGAAVLVLLFLSPFCALTSSLFAARAAHHILLTSVAAPLLAMALPRSGGSVAGWAAIHAATFWAWHAPPAYALALADDAVYWAMQASLLGSAVMVWRAVRGASAPVGVAGLLAVMVQMGLLGALLTFSASPLYARHWTTTQAWGLTPLADQQLAGLIMWVAGGAIYLAAALRLASGWLGPDSRLARA